ELEIRDDAILDMIRYYTREAGVRSLEREISKICRKVVKQLVSNLPDDATPEQIRRAAKSQEVKQPVVVTSENLGEYLGVRRYTYGMAEKQNQVGQVTGLAWTEVGGDLLTIEVADMPGKGNIL